MRVSAQAAVLRAVHARPGLTRVELVRELGIGTGFATELIARLVRLRLLTERPAEPTGQRGRPTTSLHPHPDGPLMAVAAIAHEQWQVAAFELGGGRLEVVERPHHRDRDRVLAEVASALAAFTRRFGNRIRLVAVSVPGPVTGPVLTEAPNLGWRDVNLASLVPAPLEARTLVAGNDATFAAVAESRRGAAVGAATTLHLYIDAGIGGALVEDGRALHGVSGRAGEFGHLPFGKPDIRCRCGASGCWNTCIDGHYFARALGVAPPEDEVTYTRAVIRAAGEGRQGELGAVEAAALALGRGIGGLVNALDPGQITLGGVGRSLLEVAGRQLLGGYRRGLMSSRRSSPPAVLPGALDDDAPLIGAAEETFTRFLADDELLKWGQSASQV